MKENRGVKTDIYPKNGSGLDWVKLSAIFSDISTVFLGDGEKGATLKLLYTEPNEQKQVKLIVPDAIYDEIFKVPGKPNVVPSLMSPDEKSLSKYLRELEPLIDAGRVIVRPRPLLLYKVDKSIWKVDWKTIDIDPNSPTGTLIALENSYQLNSLPIRMETSQESIERTLFEITIPYLDGLNSKDLSKVLEDEQDNLVSFRSSIKDVIKQAKSENVSNSEIINDIFRPEVNKIERRFKSIAQYHRLRALGATIGMITLSLASMNMEGWLAGVSGLLGTSGLGLLVNEYAEYLKDKNELKEKPYYLFWKLQKAKHK